MIISDIFGTSVCTSCATPADIADYITSTYGHTSLDVRFTADGVCGEHLPRDAAVSHAALYVRVRGGGGDGGSKLERRDCIPWIVDPATKPRKMDAATQARLAWTTCHISKTPLEEPIMACPLGYLYNKVSVIDALLHKTDKKKYTEDINHIKSLAEMTELQLTPAHEEASSSVLVSDKVGSEKSRWACPVLTDIPMNSTNKFVFFSKCKHVVSKKCLDQVGTKGESKCPVCNEEYYEPTAGGNFVSRNTIFNLVNTDPEVVEKLRTWLKDDQATRIPAKKASSKPVANGNGNGHGPDADAQTVMVGKRKRIELDSDTITAKRFNKLGVNHVSRTEVPAGATPEVWRKLFHDEASMPKEQGFMVRFGMHGVGGRMH